MSILFEVFTFSLQILYTSYDYPTLYWVVAYFSFPFPILWTQTDFSILLNIIVPYKWGYCLQIEEFKKFAAEPDAYKNICSMIAPSIFGHDDVKKAVACLLFGG